jgi:FtsP/CotA-like multicopper oxidase with cupredoxin domain
MRRRDFLRYSGLGIATIVIGGCGGGGGGGGGAAPSPAGGGGGGGGEVVETLNFTITDVIKEMVTHTPNHPTNPNIAECYFWVFKEDRFPAECPGPQIFCTEGDRIRVNVTNALDGRHSFVIPGMVDTGAIDPGETATVEFTVGAAGTYLYHDDYNAPVGRVMGLHGAFVVMPAAAAAGHKLTPYSNPTPAVQALYDDFGTALWWPGLAWHEGDVATQTEPTRQYIWLTHQASPVLFEEVGLFAQNNPGRDYDKNQFLDLFLNDPFIPTSNDFRVPPINDTFNRKPHFFTINGQSGHFAHDHPSITPMLRVGEPALVRILNAGLWTHSMHLHANHFFVTAVNNVPQENPLWLDVFNVYPMDHVDYTIPFMRPPDIPNARGIGRADAGLSVVGSLSRTWPPVQEFDRYHPPKETFVPSIENPLVLVDIGERQSPLCYPMHDHSEPSQVAQGGNYNCGLIAGIYFVGDRNGMMDFPRDHEFQMMLDGGGSTSATGPAAGNEIVHMPEET